MPWHHVLAHFFGGAFLANFTPHFNAGVAGRPFPTPFATPPFRGPSSPIVNILWAHFNLVVAYALLVVVGDFEWRRLAHVAISAAGFGLMSLNIARSVAKIRGGSPQIP